MCLTIVTNYGRTKVQVVSVYSCSRCTKADSDILINFYLPFHHATYQTYYPTVLVLLACIFFIRTHVLKSPIHELGFKQKSADFL